MTITSKTDEREQPVILIEVRREDYERAKRELPRLRRETMSTYDGCED